MLKITTTFELMEWLFDQLIEQESTTDSPRQAIRFGNEFYVIGGKGYVPLPVEIYRLEAFKDLETPEEDTTEIRAGTATVVTSEDLIARAVIALNLCDRIQIIGSKGKVRIRSRGLPSVQIAVVLRGKAPDRPASPPSVPMIASEAS